MQEVILFDGGMEREGDDTSLLCGLGREDHLIHLSLTSVSSVYMTNNFNPYIPKPN